MTAAAMSPDSEFVSSTERFRRELLAHCYRMLGSVDEAEDVVQETYLRAWRAYDRFEGRSSVRAWLYKIATNACLNALEGRGRRALPSGLGAPAEDPDAPIAAAGAGIAWLQPLPDALVQSESGDPAAIVALRESVRLALVASLQHLPPRQRAVLILRDVLAWRAAEVAELLDTSTTAVKSALQRARARLEEVAPEPDDIDAAPGEPERRALLDCYIAAFESADARGLERLLREDAAIELVGTRTWFAGNATCVRYLAAHVLGAPGDWRLLATGANGQPAAIAYQRGDDGAHHVYGLGLLTVAPDGVARITVFGDPGLAARCGLPAMLAAPG